MAELLQPKEEFIKMIEEYPGYDYMDFGNGLVFVFIENKINIRQYHDDGTCLSSWVKNEEFFTAIKSINKRALKINFYDEESEHTPGPWRIGKVDSVVVANTKIKGKLKGSGVNDSRAVKSYGGYLVAESVFKKENAQLIAAAPELLEAAEKIVNENLNTKVVGMDELHRAIKKAKGGIE